MILLTVFTALIVVSSFVHYFKTSPKSERWKFGPLSTLFQTVFVFVTLWITIVTIRESNSDTENLFNNLEKFGQQFSKMDSSLEGVSEKLQEMPKQIENFGKSIVALNNGIDQQRRDFAANTKHLNETIRELSNTASEYEDNIKRYNEQLELVVDMTDKQLAIWKEQQRVLLDEFSRKPILRLEAKRTSIDRDTCLITDLVIVNDGNIEANTRMILLIVPSLGFVDLKSEFFKPYQEDRVVLDEKVHSLAFMAKSYRFVTVETNIEIVAAEARIIMPCSIKMLNGFEKMIGYRIDYFSKYKSGRETGNVSVKVK